VHFVDLMRDGFEHLDDLKRLHGLETQSCP